MHAFFEQRNHSKSITRLGTKDHGTHETEKLLLLNSYAMSIGYKAHELPFQDVPAPTVRKGDSQREFMGFTYTLPTLHNVSNPTTVDVDSSNSDDSVADDEAVIAEAEAEEEPVDMDTERELGDDADVEITVGEDFVEPSLDVTRDIEERIGLDDQVEELMQKDIANKELIQAELGKLLPESNGKESTLEAFRRLSNKQPWIPFRLPGSESPADEVDREEAALFHELSSQYDRNLDGYSARSYRAFERDWNNEVSKRFSLWSNGSNIVLVRVKSRLQLQEYYDKLKSWNALRAAAPTGDDPDRQQLNNTLRTSRELLPRMDPPHTVQPTNYPAQPDGITPFGHPLTLNSEIAVGAVEALRRDNTAAPFEITLPIERIEPHRPPPRKVFRTRKYCIRCGWIRSHHDRAKEGVAFTCTRDYCGNCFKLKVHHTNSPFGIKCILPTDAYCQGAVADWYELKVCYHCLCQLQVNMSRLLLIQIQCLHPFKQS
jgi:hypothetical protein